MADDNTGVDELLADLQTRLKDLIEAARREGAEQALAEIRNVVSTRLDSPAPAAKAKPRRTRAKAAPPAPKKTRAKAAKAPKAKGKTKSGKPRKNWWATATEAQKRERKRKMLAGRGLVPKDER